MGVRSDDMQYDHLRTMNVIYQDYLGPSPIFDDTLLQWIFQISGNVYNLLKTSLQEHSFSMWKKMTYVDDPTFATMQNLYCHQNIQDTDVL